eukprot:6453755-Pyramimonas_sp.AAC.1
MPRGAGFTRWLATRVFETPVSLRNIADVAEHRLASHTSSVASPDAPLSIRKLKDAGAREYEARAWQERRVTASSRLYL